MEQTIAPPPDELLQQYITDDATKDEFLSAFNITGSVTPQVLVMIDAKQKEGTILKGFQGALRHYCSEARKS